MPLRLPPLLVSFALMSSLIDAAPAVKACPRSRPGPLGTTALDIGLGRLKVLFGDHAMLEQVTRPAEALFGQRQVDIRTRRLGLGLAEFR